jgi:hypothetical protein
MGTREHASAVAVARAAEGDTLVLMTVRELRSDGTTVDAGILLDYDALVALVLRLGEHGANL